MIPDTNVKDVWDFADHLIKDLEAGDFGGHKVDVVESFFAINYCNGGLNPQSLSL